MSALAPTTLALRVYYEDTDASGVVYHGSYLRFFERARTEWLRAQGFGQDALLREFALAFTVASLQIDFCRPSRLDDELQVTTRVREPRRASLVFEQSLHRLTDQTLIARCEVRVGCVAAADFRPQRLPPQLATRLAGGVRQDPRSAQKMK